MPDFTAGDTIRILVSTDNHVGYNERDPIRGDDSWKSFHEVMCLAKDRDVDMVLLAGDLFHENQPSRKSMYQVMRTLRLNCYGEKPCELEMLSDASETFAGAFNHVNYEDPDINVSMPVFSIHGNHDDPSGEGHLAALDILQMSGLVNYYGRTPESDNIQVKPVLLQKGKTKLALYGMSNVRDERLFRTFRDGNVKFFQPGTQKDDWFNIMSVHQNHHAYTDTGYLPENFLPSFLDLVVWGHEHECIIDPRVNPETTFRVMQPGSSVATSLVPSEAIAKHVAILTIRGKSFESENIRLKTVRPFVMREIALIDARELHEAAFENEDVQRPKIIRYLDKIVYELIDEAKQQWLEARESADESIDEDEEPPKPLIRLRVEYTAPEGGKFYCDNPQRFSNRFQGKVANTTDVVQFHRKRKAAKQVKGIAEMPEESVMAQLNIDSVKVEKLVQEFLTAQSLSILPQNTFSHAVGEFVDKDDKDAMQYFVKDSLSNQVSYLLAGDEDDDEDAEDEIDPDRLAELMEANKAMLEQKFGKGQARPAKGKNANRKPKPDWWDDEMDGSWEDDPASIIREDEEQQDDDMESVANGPAKKASARGGRGGRAGKAATGTTRKTAAASKKAPAKTTRGKKKQISEDEDEDEDDDVIMLDDDDDDDDEEELFVKPAAKKAAAPAAKKATAKAAPKSSTQSGRQTQISFGGTQSQAAASRAAPKAANGRAATTRAPAKRLQEPSEDEISDDDDAFEPPPPSARTRGGRR